MITHKAIVTEVYDGDTITVDIHIHVEDIITFSAIVPNQKVRLLDVAAPEVRGDSREAGLLSRDYLRNLILGKEVSILVNPEGKRKDSFGRWLAYISLGELEINYHMITSEFAERWKP